MITISLELSLPVIIHHGSVWLQVTMTWLHQFLLKSQLGVAFPSLAQGAADLSDLHEVKVKLSWTI